MGHKGEKIKNWASGRESVAGDRKTTATINYAGVPPAERVKPKRRTVFVVHGRDDKLRSAMFGLLRALRLEVQEWPQLLKATGETAPFTGKVVADALSRARAAVVLLSPDDVAHLHESLWRSDETVDETQPMCQPRPNVLVELGMALATFPQRTILVQAGILRPVSDLTGRQAIQLDGTEDALRQLAQRLKDAGCDVDDGGRDWLDTSRFAGLDAYARRAPGCNR